MGKRNTQRHNSCVLLVRRCASACRLALGAQAVPCACEEPLRFAQRNSNRRRDLRQCRTVDLMHEQDLTLARIEQTDQLVIARGVVPGLIDRAAEDSRIPGTIQLM